MPSREQRYGLNRPTREEYLRRVLSSTYIPEGGAPASADATRVSLAQLSAPTIRQQRLEPGEEGFLTYLPSPIRSLVGGVGNILSGDPRIGRNLALASEAVDPKEYYLSMLGMPEIARQNVREKVTVLDAADPIVALGAIKHLGAAAISKVLRPKYVATLDPEKRAAIMSWIRDEYGDAFKGWDDVFPAADYKELVREMQARHIAQRTDSRIANETLFATDETGFMPLFYSGMGNPAPGTALPTDIKARVLDFARSKLNRFSKHAPDELIGGEYTRLGADGSLTPGESIDRLVVPQDHPWPNYVPNMGPGIYASTDRAVAANFADGLAGGQGQIMSMVPTSTRLARVDPKNKTYLSDLVSLARRRADVSDQPWSPWDISRAVQEDFVDNMRVRGLKGAYSPYDGDGPIELMMLDARDLRSPYALPDRREGDWRLFAIPALMAGAGARVGMQED